MNKNPRTVFREIADWKLDAKLEDTDRYFFKTHDIELLIKGDKSFVIGRKGTGKTAIAKHIKQIQGYNQFSKTLSLKNFPFNELYELDNESYTKPNQYITIWKYIIYSNLLYLMSENERTDPSLTEKIRKLMPKDPEKALSRSIKEWVSGGFSAGFASFSLGVSGNTNESQVSLSWIDRVQILEDVILENIDESNYFILFDELDEDYRYQALVGDSNNYLILITGLFKAIQDIKSVSSNAGKNINPILFLRDDIFAELKDPDKTKWDDFTVYLNWTKFTIQPLLAHRISKSLNDSNSESRMSFGKAWYSIFQDEKIGIGRNRRQKEITIYEWISRNTHLRPRDYIKYLQLCAVQSYESSYYKMNAGLVQTQDGAYSRYLKSELTDEIHSLLPDIESILDIFSTIGEAYIPIEKFCEIYSQQYELGVLKVKDPKIVLKTLFNFSVIGNQKKNNQKVFHYENPGVKINYNESIVIHRGLYKSLRCF
tara:strand:+ start:110 stop:1561 length:1452 start_codon:yes stop_codon:yes gene_type:complete